MYLDDVIHSEYEYITGELGIALPEKFWDYQVKSYNAIARQYVLEYKDWLKKEHDLTLDSLTFESLNSPKEYNFVTDRIFCELSIFDIEKLHKFAIDNEILTQKTIDGRFKSRDGFASFYDEFCIDWKTKPVLEWDCNELAILLPEPDCYTRVWGDDTGCFFWDQIEWAHNTDYESLIESKEV
jgi:hypothetical protein